MALGWDPRSLSVQLVPPLVGGPQLSIYEIRTQSLAGPPCWVLTKMAAGPREEVDGRAMSAPSQPASHAEHGHLAAARGVLLRQLPDAVPKRA